VKPRRDPTVESLFPIAAGRRAGDEAVDATPMSATLAEACDAFEQAYFEKTGTSPFRKNGR
jgi:hypothetical protein